jgi:hypothetical protein
LTIFQYSNKLLHDKAETKRGISMVVITMKLEDEQAQALVQFCNRAGFNDFRNYATTDKEATNMLSASYLIATELNKAGIQAK